MSGEDIDRRDFACLIIRDHMHDRQAFGRPSKPLALIEHVVLGFRRHAQWRSVRKVKEGDVTADLYAFLTTDPNAEVKAIHPKAMSVILTTPEECETWMTAPWEQAWAPQRPLPDGSLNIVASGVKMDGGDPEVERPAQASLICRNPRREARSRGMPLDWFTPPVYIAAENAGVRYAVANVERAAEFLLSWNEQGGEQPGASLSPPAWLR